MNTSEPMFGRMIPAMVTPFDDELQLDTSRIRNLVDFLVDGGSDSILWYNGGKPHTYHR